MAMEDHHHYGMADLRQFMNTRPHFPPIPLHSDLFPAHHHHRNLTPTQPYDLMMVGRQVTHDMMSRGLHDFVTDSAAPPPTTATNTNTVVPTSNATLTGLDAEAACLGADASTGRWPRQETLTLLEIRSRLDSKFKEANQKGPLWDEVSRIMSEEHGYQRSGKKCREKFENLYKYYKKTKEGKAGRQDGKHYRFFRQLEALYGDTSNAVSVPETHLAGSSLTFHTATNLNVAAQQNQEIFQTPKLCDSLSLSNSSDFDTSSSEDDDHNNTGPTENGSTDKKNRRGRRSWKVKIKDFIDSQMRKLVEKQEAWLEKMLKALEHKEQERILREEEWRKQEAARLDREHKFWATQRAWIEARDAALMDTLQKLTGREIKAPSPAPEVLMATQLRNPGERERQNENGSETLNNSVKGDSWPESEIARLMQLRTSMESRFQQAGSSEEVLWEDIAAKMACLGYDRSAIMCKDKWNSINNYLLRTKECNKKRKENSRSCTYFLSNETLYNQGGAYCEISEPGPEMARLQPNEGSPPSNSNAGSAVPDSCFRFLMADGNLWENYALKLNKGDNQ